MNKTPIYVIAGCLVGISILAGLSGCDVRKQVSVDIPPSVANAIGVSADSNLKEAQVAWEDWQVWVERESAKFATEIEDASARFAMLNSVTDMGLQALETQAGSIPGGALLVSGLTFASGLMLRRPGDKKRQDDLAAKVAELGGENV